MTDFDKDLIISLSKLLEETGLSEIEIENKDVGRIKVAKNLFNSNILTSSPNNTNDNLVAEKEDSSEQKDLSNAISSPMVGTIYLKPDPESEPFVNEGDKVKKGDTLLIIEAMKTMNNIPADKDGVIKKVLVENEQPIQFGDPLVIIE
ncbi:MAG: acetyl-CoA carboxylase biotin carboxyl carrier protein [Alphaproteobacteria bacterium]